MERQGLRFVRYADDFSIYCKTKQEAKAAGNAIFLFLKHKLKLEINRDKSGIRRPVHFQILGYGFVPVYRKGERGIAVGKPMATDGKYQLVVSKKKWKALKQKLKEVTRKTSPTSFEERIQQVNAIQRGWLNYFKYGSIQQKLVEIDGWLRNRLRYCIWTDWKKPDKKRRSLIRLGVEPSMAYAWSRTRMGGWAVAQSPILGTTITVKRLKLRGYVPLSELYSSLETSNYRNSLFPMI